MKTKKSTWNTVIEKKDLEYLSKVYFSWKDFDELVKVHNSRGINFPEILSEWIVCYINKFSWKPKNSADAMNEKRKIQIKATSNFHRDCSSFGPKSEFDELHFVRLNRNEDKIYLYKILENEIKNINLTNEKITFTKRQESGKRPRFSIIKQILTPLNIKYYATIHITKNNILIEESEQI